MKRSPVYFAINFLLAVLTVIGMYSFSTNTHILRTLEEERFEAWFLETEKKLREGSQEKPIIVELSSTLPSIKGSWLLSYDPQSTDGSWSKVLGVLRLLRASRVFHEKSNHIARDGFSFSIRSGEKHFSSFFSSGVVSSNISLKSLIVLMREYTEEDIEQTKSPQEKV